MITHAGTISIYVSDQSRAVEWYVETLGFEKRTDASMSKESPDVRWLEVAPPGAQTVIALQNAAFFGNESRVGGFADVTFECDDVQATAEALAGRGVEITKEPTTEPWGTYFQFQDVDGNEFVVTQRRS